MTDWMICYSSCYTYCVKQAIPATRKSMLLVHQSVLARPAGVPRAEGRGANGGVKQLVGGPGGGAGGCG